jgi:glycosyltransferase involved in cell wall biosynthesis
VHIVMVNHGYRPLPPEPADSPAIVIDQLATALTRRAVRVTTICGRGSGLSRPYEIIELSPPTIARHSSAVVAELLFAAHAGRLVGSLGGDVIHHHASTPAALRPPRGQAPVVFSYAAPVSQRGRSPTMGRLSGISEFLEWSACKRADRVVAVSVRAADFVRRRYGVAPRRVAMISNGVDHRTFTPPAEEPRAQVVLCVARIARYKDQATLVRALARPPLAGQSVRLILAGPVDDAAYANDLKRLAGSLGIGGRVELIGQIGFDRLPEMYRSAAVVVAPSHAEGMPLALLEAMSCGRAVVASAISQHLEIGADAGVVFVPPGDPDETSRALESLLADTTARATAGMAARRRVVERFSWDAIAEQFERLYTDLSE